MQTNPFVEEEPGDAWQRRSCGNGAKGPRVYDWAAAKLPANFIFDPDPPSHDRWVMVRRSISDPGEIALPAGTAGAGGGRGGNVPDGGGHKVLGRAAGREKRSGADYSYLHTAVDDHSRLACGEIHPDEKKETATGFRSRAQAFFTQAGITVGRTRCHRRHAVSPR